MFSKQKSIFFSVYSFVYPAQLLLTFIMWLFRLQWQNVKKAFIFTAGSSFKECKQTGKPAVSCYSAQKGKLWKNAVNDQTCVVFNCKNWLWDIAALTQFKVTLKKLMFCQFITLIISIFSTIAFLTVMDAIRIQNENDHPVLLMYDSSA